MKIAACLICKDSAATIERALSSIRPFVGEINVYDTGSTDGTPALLRKLARKKKALYDTRTAEFVERKGGQRSLPEGVVEIPLAPIRVTGGEWRDDFSWAREQSFAMASDDVDWYFWLDDDDVIVGAHNLAPLAASAHPSVSGFMAFYDYAQDEFGNNICQLWRERLLRRTSDGAWVNPVHEVWLPHGEGGAMPHYQVVPPDTLRFVHHRDPARQTADRNLLILEKKAIEAQVRGELPDPRTTHYMGSELMTHGRFADAAEWLERYLSHPETLIGDERSQAHHKLAICLRELGQTRQALAIEFSALHERDDWTENAAGLGETFFQLGEFARAKTWLKRAVEQGMPQSMLILNPLELQFMPMVRLAECHAALGEFGEALHWLQRATAMRPGDPILAGIGQAVQRDASTSEIVAAVLKLRETLIRYDENEKAWALMASAVPYVVAEHPMISSAKAMTRENVMHMLAPEEYLRWYEDEPKESTVEDEHVKQLGDMIERAAFTLELARKFEAEHKRKPRILDLGCNDGWMACYLWQEGEFVADGIELNKASVEKGIKRLERFGAPGRIVQGDIHKAKQLLGHKYGLGDAAFELDEPYDIVTCYEVFEHVPDTNRLLSRMEELLSPEGSACITTPAGAFEQGNLEFWHLVERKGHLRAVTPTELAGQIVERGWIDDFRIHQENRLSWVNWHPFRRRKRVHIVAPGAWEPWEPSDIRSRGIGGSETCLAYLAVRLSLRGHDVRVFTDATPGVTAQSVWRPYAAFDPSEEADAIIVSRAPALFQVDLHAPVRALWCHDAVYPDLVKEHERMTDIVVLSEWQRSSFQRMYPWTEDRLRIIRNGIATTETWPHDAESRFPHAHRSFEERKPQAIYSSSADRGLDVLLQMWPEIRSRVPDAELRVFYGWDVFDAVARTQPHLIAYKQHVMALYAAAGGEDSGIRWEGRVGQDALYAAMQEARVWSYPTAFHETSCISAMESRASGLPIVTSDLGALHETVGEHGYLVPWDSDEMAPHNQTDVYRNAFVGRVVAMLTDPVRWSEAHEKALEGVDELDWERRIDVWESMIEGSH